VTRTARLSVFILILCASGTLEAASIRNLKANWNGGTVSVAFNLERAFDEGQIRQALQSGLPTGFTYHVELIRKRPNWFDDTLDDTTIEVIATLNSVTREYLLNYRIGGKLVRSETISDAEELKRRMTSIAQDDLFDRVRASPSKLRVRVRADLLRGYLLGVIPWDVSTDWQETRVNRPTEPSTPPAVTSTPRKR
jgi:hypothetical protein